MFRYIIGIHTYHISLVTKKNFNEFTIFRINTKHVNEWDEHNLTQSCRSTTNVKFKNN